MASCISALSTPPSTVLEDDVLTPLVVTRLLCATYTYAVAQFGVVTLAVTVTPTPQTAFTALVKIFRAGEAAPAVQAALTDLTTVMTAELAAGLYYVCVETQGTVSLAGTIVTASTQYQGFASMKSGQGAGETLRATLSFVRKPSACSTTLFYEVTEGQLPPGIRMTSLGQIRGVLPENDCLGDNAALPPSQTWGYTEQGQTRPWGRQWRFKVRVWPEGTPDVYAEQWFCVASHNDWSRDRDAFLAQAPFTVFSYESVETRTDVIPTICEVPSVAPEFSRREIARLETEKTVEKGVVPIETVCTPCLEEVKGYEETVGLPKGVRPWGDEGFVVWVGEHLRRAQEEGHAELTAYFTALKESKAYAAVLAGDRQVEVTHNFRAVITRDTSKDPLVVYRSARDMARTALPWYSLSHDGAAMTISME